MQDIFWYMYFENVIYILLVQFFLLLVLVVFNFRDIAEEFSKIKKKTIILALAISVLGSLLMLLSGYQMGGGDWFDLIVAKEFSNGLTGYYTSEYYYGPFFPLLTSLIFYVFGANPVHVNFLNSSMMALTPFIVFLVFYTMFRNENFALVTSVVSLLTILHQSSYHSEFFYVTSFFMGLALLFSFLSFKINKKSMYLLALITILLLGQIKLEYMSVLPAFLLGLVIFRGGDFTSVKKFVSFLKDRFLVPLLIFLLLSGAYIAKFYHVWETWYLQYAFQLSHLEVSSKGFLYFWATSPNIYLSFLFATGVVCAFVFKEHRKEIILLLSFFILHNIPYLLHYNGYQECYGILTYMPYVIISGFGVRSLAKILNEKLKMADHIIPAVLMILFLSSYALVLNSRGPLGFENINVSFSRFAVSDCELEIARIVDFGNSSFLIVQDDSSNYKWTFLTLRGAEPLQWLVTSSGVYRDYIKTVKEQYPNIFSSSIYFYNETYATKLEDLERDAYNKSMERIYNMSRLGGVENPLNISFGDGEFFYIHTNPGDITSSLFKEIYNLTRIYECDDYTLYRINNVTASES